MPLSTGLSRSPGPLAPLTVWLGFGMMCVGMFMAILDVQVVATAIPTIAQALDIPADGISWVQTAYLIAEVIAIPLTGIFTRVFGMRLLFAMAVSSFTVASIGCAASGGFASLIVWRSLQGFAGGTLIPGVFSAVFLLFPERQHGAATTLAGVLAVLAPTVGPIVGGWITQTYSWPWLFLVNVAPGVIAASLGFLLLPHEATRWRWLRGLDGLSLLLMAAALAGLILALKEAPQRGWLSALVLGLFLVSIAASAAFGMRARRRTAPLVQLATFRDRRFSVGCLLSFVVGIGMFGSVYLMPVFLAVAHDYGALQIGKIMLVTGISQLLTAPIAVELDRRVDPRLLSFAGFALFALGLGLSAFQDIHTDYDEMFWPQVVRGVAMMFCLLPSTRLALATLPLDVVADASGLFNLMRNLGGAIGLALIDTVIFTRSPLLGETILQRLLAGDVATVKAIGLPLASFAQASGQIDPRALAAATPLIENLAFIQAMNEAWATLALLTIATTLGLLTLISRSNGSLDKQVPRH